MNPNARSFNFNPGAAGFLPPQVAAQQAAQQQQQQQQQQGAGQGQSFNQQQPYYAQQAYGGYPQYGGAAGGYPQQGYYNAGAGGYYQQGAYQGAYPQQPTQHHQSGDAAAAAQPPHAKAQLPQRVGGAGASAGAGAGGGGAPAAAAPQRSKVPPPAQPRAPIPGNPGLPAKPAAATGANEDRAPVSISLGGGGASSSNSGASTPNKAAATAASGEAATRKPVSISIGGKGAATAEKKPVSISIGGGGAAKDAVPAKEEDASAATATSTAPAAAGGVSAVKANETATPAAGSSPSAPGSRADSPAPASDAPVNKGGQAAKRAAKVDTKVEKSQTTAEKVLEEASKATDAETLKDLFGDKSEDLKQHLNIVFIGHVDAGKSTMGGQILYLTDMVDKRTMEKFEREAKEAGRESWYLSWALDSTPQEREKGKTVEVGRAYFETGKRRYTILDAPGHKTYVPNMISGAAQADVAVLVISARRGEFETGFERGGQTREHAMLVKTAGVQKLVVVVNKMDEPTVQWDQARYDEIVGKLTPFLRSAGFNPKTDLTYIPVSAYAGQNLKEPLPAGVGDWYKGPTLLSFLDDLELGDRKISEPLMMPISEKYSEMGTVVVGKLESGKVKRGDTLLLMPNGVTVEASTITNEVDEEVPAAISGDNVRIKLRGVDSDDVSAGFVLTDPRRPVHVVTQFEAQLAILESRNIICAGYSAVMHVHTLSEEVVLTKLLHYFDKKTGRKSKKPPPFAKKGDRVSVLVETTAPICVEKFSEHPQLGRFTVRDEGRTVGIGKVTKLLKRGGGGGGAGGGGGGGGAGGADDAPDVSKMSLNDSGAM